MMKKFLSGIFLAGLASLGLMLTSCNNDPTGYTEDYAQKIPLSTIEMTNSEVQVDFSGSRWFEARTDDRTFPLEGELRRIGSDASLSLDLRGQLVDTMPVFYPNLTAMRLLEVRIELDAMPLYEDNEGRFLSNPNLQETDTLVSLLFERMHFAPPFMPDTIVAPAFASINLDTFGKGSSEVTGTIQLYSLIEQEDQWSPGPYTILYALSSEVRIR